VREDQLQYTNSLNSLFLSFLPASSSHRPILSPSFFPSPCTPGTSRPPSLRCSCFLPRCRMACGHLFQVRVLPFILPFRELTLFSTLLGPPLRQTAPQPPPPRRTRRFRSLSVSVPLFPPSSSPPPRNAVYEWPLWLDGSILSDTSSRLHLAGIIASGVAFVLFVGVFLCGGGCFAMLTFVRLVSLSSLSWLSVRSVSYLVVMNGRRTARRHC
jgi:hypothetical protein